MQSQSTLKSHLLIIWLPILSCTTGCRQESSTSPANPALDSPGTSSSNAARTNVAGTGFTAPFRGTIKAQEQRDILLNSWEITYLIGDGRIRREAKRTAPLVKLTDLQQGVAGIICDLRTSEILLYRGRADKQRFVRMSLPDYRKLTAEVGPAKAPFDTALYLVTVGSSVRKHAGTFFLEIASPIPAAHSVNAPDARTIAGIKCDLLTIRQGDTVFEVAHSHLIAVDRQLLELVELRMPEEVTGFPCLMRRLQLVPTQPVDPTASPARQLVQGGIRWAADVAEKVLQRELQVLEAVEAIPPDSAFELDAGFTECSSLDELNRLFRPAEGADDDDWD